MADVISFVGLDVHKESIVVAVASGGLRGEVREYGRIANTAMALDRVLRKFGGDGVTLRCERGTGSRPSRRDAASLARLHRAGELTAVWVLDARHEAMRWYGHVLMRCMR